MTMKRFVPRANIWILAVVPVIIMITVIQLAGDFLFRSQLEIQTEATTLATQLSSKEHTAFDSAPSIATTQVQQTLITLFTTFKEDEARIPVHSLVVKNWAALKPYVRPVLFSTRESGQLLDLAYQYRWDVRPVPGVNYMGTPFVKAMYLKAYEEFDTPLYAYSNGDLLYSEDFIETLKGLVDHFAALNGSARPFGIGRRCNVHLDGTEPEDLWQPTTVKHTALTTALHRVDAFDVFITERMGLPWKQVPDIVVGRGGIGQFLYLAAEFFNLTTVDISLTSRIIHLQGVGIHMTHKSDPNKDKMFNKQVLQAAFGRRIPFGLCVTSRAQAYTITVDNKVVVKNRNKKKIGDDPRVLAMKFGRIFMDEHVFQPYLTLKPVLRDGEV